ncbi:hypothetical protein FEK31_24840 [Nocardia cyriacigeorgica]|nr:hypothetical protein [Nocardia cyriacigeorgica]TLF54242.1 hypothetical protein FEK31_24840 [Nocardia cyriacigeorgica]
MCSPVRCRTCGKTTWSGCGAHIEAVRARVGPDNWCPGHRMPEASVPGKVIASDEDRRPRRPGWFRIPRSTR